MKVVIVLPTYNERDNVAPLVDALQAQFLAMPHEMSILVVDDHSPDGTAEVVRTVQARYPNVGLIEGKKNGLGAAYVRGFRHAIAVTGPGNKGCASYCTSSVGSSAGCYDGANLPRVFS